MSGPEKILPRGGHREQTGSRVVEAQSSAQEPLWHGAPELLRLSARERLLVLEQLSVLLESGIQVPAALQSMREQSSNPRVAEVLAFLEDVVRNGQPLSVGVVALPGAFPELVAQMVSAGEKAGRLAEMILRVTEMLEAEEELRGRLRSATLYPAIMLILAFAVVVFLLTAIVPKFAGLFRGKESALPPPTRLLMFLGEFFSAHALWLLPALALTLGGTIAFLSSAAGKPYLDGMLLRLPVIGGIYRTAILSRTSRTLGMLTQSGVAILTALEHTRDVAGSPAFVRLWDQVHREVANGHTISEAIGPSRLLPATYKQMVGSGEATAQLDTVLLKIATHCARNLQRQVRDATTIIEPILIVFMGGVVGFIALSIMLPIFKLSRGI